MGSIKLQLRSTLSPKVVKTKARPSTFVASLLHTYLVTSGLDLGLKPELELCISGGAVTLDLEETVGGEALSKGTIVEVRRRRKARRPPSSPLLLSPRLGVGNEKEVISRGTEVNFESSTEEGGGLDEWEDTPSRLPRPRQMSGLAVCTSAYSSSTPTVASRPGPGSSVSPEDSSTSEVSSRIHLTPGSLFSDISTTHMRRPSAPLPPLAPYPMSLTMTTSMMPSSLH